MNWETDKRDAKEKNKIIDAYTDVLLENPVTGEFNNTYWYIENKPAIEEDNPKINKRWCSFIWISLNVTYIGITNKNLK